MFQPKFTRNQGPGGSLQILTYHYWIVSAFLGCAAFLYFRYTASEHLVLRESLNDLFIVALGFGFAVYCFEWNSFVFDTTTRRVRWRKISFTGVRTGDIGFDEITGFRLDQYADWKYRGSGGRTFYMLTLETGTGFIRVNNRSFYNAALLIDIGEQIMAMVKGNNPIPSQPGSTFEDKGIA